jgi:hypothetical protein
MWNFPTRPWFRLGLVEFLAWDLMGSSWDFMWDFHGNLLAPQIIPT